MAPLLLLLHCLTLTLTTTTSAQSTACRTSCGNLPVSYPFGLNPGCGSPYYHNLLSCTSDVLRLRTPSGSYSVRSISYSDTHLVVSDPSMWSCRVHDDWSSRTPPRPPFALDSSTRLSLSPTNDFLFFNCSPDSVLVRPKPAFCDRYPNRCEPVCDSSGYLCRNIPGCPDKLAATGTTCCSYFPTASESVRLMLGHCAAWASVYWRTVGDHVPTAYDQVPEYGIKVDFEVPVTARCRKCRERGGGICGYDTVTWDFQCLCDQGNVTTYCGGA